MNTFNGMPELTRTFAAGEFRKLVPLDKILAAPAGKLRATAGAPIFVPRDQWFEVDMDPHIGPITDQNGIGQCNAATSVEIVMGQRSMQGMPYVALSAGDLYNRICNGVDEGSLPEDALKELQDNGVNPVSIVPFLDWRTSHGAGERAKYKIGEADPITTADGACSELQSGFMFDLCMAWYNSDSSPDSEGRLSSRPGGSAGGHSLTACGMKLFGADWYIKFRNHWTARYGVNGCGYLPVSRLESNLSQFRMWACRQVSAESGGLPAPIWPAGFDPAGKTA